MRYKLTLLIIVSGCLSITIAYPRNKRNLYDVKQYLRSMITDPFPQILEPTEMSIDRVRNTDLITKQPPFFNEEKIVRLTAPPRKNKRFLKKVLTALGVVYLLRMIVQKRMLPQ